MTHADLVERIRQSLADDIAAINQLRVHDQRIVGQLEAYRHIEQLLMVLGAQVNAPIALPPQDNHKAATPVKTSRPVKRKRARVK